MATTLENINIKDDSSWNTLLDLIYPVGSYYLSNSSTSPATRFGGTWSTLSGAFLYPNNNSNTTTGGSNNAIVVSHNHTASTASAGAHYHSEIFYTLNYSQSNSESHTTNWSGQRDTAYRNTATAGAHTHTVKVNSSGSSGTGKNMPYYKSCYCWYRTV